MPLVFINILVWNGEKWIKKCLDSVLSMQGNFKIMVIDNHSTDKSAKVVEKYYPQVEIIKNKKNLGFAEGNNVGIRHALKHGAEYIALLNQDVIVSPLFLIKLVEFAKEHREFGILSPMQYNYEGSEIDPNFLNVLRPNRLFREDEQRGTRLRQVYEVHAVIGAGMFIRREVFLKAGLFDPLFFTYHEEADLCRRVLYHGFKIGVVTASKINHWHTLIHSGRLTFRNEYLSTRNTFILLLKNQFQPIKKNLFDYLKYILQVILKNMNSIKGIMKNIFIIFIQLWVIFHLPLIIYKRSIERRGACYLK